MWVNSQCHFGSYEATARASVYIYNTREDVDYFIDKLKQIIADWNDLSKEFY